VVRKKLPMVTEMLELDQLLTLRQQVVVQVENKVIQVILLVRRQLVVHLME
jgi:hypothetical protein